MYKNLIISTTALVLFMFASSALGSNYANSFGASPKGLALGNAMCATVNDWSSVYYNISGLGKTVGKRDAVFDGEKKRKNQIGVSFLHNDPDVFHNNPRYESSDSNVNNLTTLNSLETGSFVIGATVEISLLTNLLSNYLSSCRFGLIAGLNNDLSLVKINDIDLRTHNFITYGRETQSIMIMMGLGIGFLNDTFGFGIGAAPSMGGSGKILARELIISTEDQTPAMQANFDFEIAKNPLIYGAYLKPGNLFPPLKGLDIGISYRDESYLYIDDFQMAAVVEAGNIPMTLLAGMFDFYAPKTTTYGLAYTKGKITVALDIEERKWSQYKVSAVRADEFAGKLPDLDDITIPKLGVQYRYNKKLELLCGYYKQDSFIPDSATKGDINFLDNDKQVYSIGLTYQLTKADFVHQFLQFKGPIDLTLSVQHQKFDTRNVTKDNPTTMNPSYSYGGKFNSIMVGFTYNL